MTRSGSWEIRTQEALRESEHARGAAWPALLPQGLRLPLPRVSPLQRPETGSRSTLPQVVSRQMCL